MSWENANDLTEEETKADLASNNDDTKATSRDEQLQNEIIKLQKYQDPAKNLERQAYLSLLKQFGEFLTTNNIQTMVKTILTDDCKFFLFSSTTGRAPAKYCLRPEDLHNLYKGIQIKERRAREIYIDIEKTSAVQLCNFKTLYEGQDDPTDEIVAEVFTIKDNKICKYRAFFSEITSAHGQADPFAASVKSKSLAKVMEINYAISDQPDFEKVASLLHNNAEYKIWSWDLRKCFAFTKQDLAEKFRNELEENYVIKSIVPYEVFTEAKFVYGTYVYHLEGKSGENKNKKFVWLSTCVYSFDKNLNIIKVAQQGELYPEGEVTIPFAVYSRETLLQTVNKITRNIKPSADAFYDDLVDFNCMSYHFGCESMPNIGVFRGLDNMDMVIAESKKGNLSVSHLKAIDLFVDSNGSSYDHVITIPWCVGKFTFPGFKHSGVEMNIISFVIYTLENGKMVKSFSIVAMIPESIPAPFEDLYPEGTNLISRGVET